MNFKRIKNNAMHNVRQASPYIWFGVGVVSFGMTIASAVKASMSLNSVLEAHKETRDDIEEVKQDTLAVKEGEKTEVADKVVAEVERESKRAVRKLYFRTGRQLARLYAPTMALGALSLGSFTASAGILRGRYIMATGALQRVTEAFDKYRARVVEDAGEEKDLEYYYGLKKDKVTMEEINEETGKTKTVRKDALVGNPDGLFTYRFCKFDSETGEGSTEWDRSNTYNWTYIMNIIKGYQLNLDAGMRVYLDRLLGDLGFLEINKSEEKKMSEHMAGWIPGDTILCGLEDRNGLIIFDDLKFKNGDSSDVTLRFNCRTNVFNTKIKKEKEAAKIEEKA